MTGGALGREGGADEALVPGLAALLADGVALLGPDGSVVWANQALADLLHTTFDDLIGTQGLDLVHPAELDRAADGLVYAAQFPGRTAVAPYRVRRADGTWQDIELKSGIVPGPDGDHVVLVVRDGSSRQAINRALRTVASGATLEESALAVCEAVVQRWPGSGAAVTCGGIDGDRMVVSLHLDDRLVAHARGEFGDPEVWAPWDAVEVRGPVTVLTADDLAPSLAAAASAAGYEGCALAAVPDPTAHPATLVAWFDHAIIARLEFRHWAAELVEILALALDRRHRSWQLAHLARHDALTGLLNRIGFFEQLDALLGATRAEGDRSLGLLYVDLDGLKEVNDLEGHAAGDRLLVHAAERLRDGAGEDGLIARIGGDEFVVARAFPGDDAIAALDAFARELADALGRPHPDDLVPVRASIGLALDEPDLAVGHLLERADAAMYRAKTNAERTWSL